MRRSRIHRKRRYAWFQPIGGVQQAEAPADDQYFQRIVLVGGADYSQALAIVPIVYDAPTEDSPGILTAGPASLSDQQGSDWFVERIVGKLDLVMTTGVLSVGTDTWIPTYMVGAGLFVARADESTPSLPIGEAADFNTDYSPINWHTARNPWMWHRTWSLNVITSANGTLVAANKSDDTIPAWGSNNNIGPPGLNNGNIVDTTVNRRIGRDERLFLAIATQGLSFGSATPPTRGGILLGVSALRILGALRRSTGRSAF